MPNVWLITACASGFGYEIAAAALEHGDTVVATARDPSKLGDLKAKGAITVKLDVTSPDDVLASTVADVLKQVEHIDILVNCAGYILQGAVEECSTEEIHAVFNTNVYGALALTRAVLPHMRSRQQGTIANLGSIGGWIGTPAAGLYCATKAALTVVTESLRAEVAALGITVTAIEPGYFRTGFLNQGHQVVAKSRIEGLGDQVESMKGMLGSYGGKQPGDPKKGARVVVEALTGTGSCVGRSVPARLALGSDAVGYIGGVLDANKKTLEEWKDVVASTNHDDVETA